MTQGEKAAQLIPLPADRPASVLRPSATLTEVMDGKRARDELIKNALIRDQDFGIIPGTRKETLYKPGAEQIAGWYNCAPTFETSDSTIDIDKGIYRYVRVCRLIHRPTGVVAGEGAGVASTTEKKYQGREQELENTILKMADKRALVAAVLFTFALSDRFAQDLDDGAGVEGAPSATGPDSKESSGQTKKSTGFGPDKPNTFFIFPDKKNPQLMKIGVVPGDLLTDQWLTRAGYREWAGKYYIDFLPDREKDLVELGGKKK